MFFAGWRPLVYLVGLGILHCGRSPTRGFLLRFSNSFFLLTQQTSPVKTDLNTVVLPLTDGRQRVHGISDEVGDALGDKQVKPAHQRVLNLRLKPSRFWCSRT